jgi:hypothetical protein
MVLALNCLTLGQTVPTVRLRLILTVEVSLSPLKSSKIFSRNKNGQSESQAPTLSLKSIRKETTPASNHSELKKDSAIMRAS